MAKIVIRVNNIVLIVNGSLLENRLCVLILIATILDPLTRGDTIEDAIKQSFELLSFLQIVL